MKFSILTIFSDIFKGFLSEALIARAIKKKIIRLDIYNLRRWTRDAHKTVDGRPYGGGVGMVMMVEPIKKALETLKKGATKKTKVILFSAKGKKFDQAVARKWSKLDHIILICGRYEGVDERVARYLADEEISIGDYVLFGGEVPAMAVMEAVARMLPGVVGKQKSIEDESFTNLKRIDRKEALGVLEYPHYTRPKKIVIKGKTRTVPKVLLAGNHKDIDAWRKNQSYLLTKKRRPDLLK